MLSDRLVNDYLSEKVGAFNSNEEQFVAKKITADLIIYRDICYYLHVLNHPLTIDQTALLRVYQVRLFKAILGI